MKIIDKGEKGYISYNAPRNQYIVYRDGHSFGCSIVRYGSLALKLAEKILDDGIRYQDYFEDDGLGTTTIFVNTHAYGIKEVKVDTEDMKRLYSIKISVYEDAHAKTSYASTKFGKLHRFLLGLKKSDDVVDHIDRNGLNDKKSNLRVVDVSTNNRNATLRKDNTSSFRGICNSEMCVRVFYYDNKKKKKSKSFSKAKYGAEALPMAISFRNMVYKKYGYIA